MRVNVWGINYAPEATGIAPYNTALCTFLQAQGHQARMVTAFPYYPEWHKHATDRARLFRTDILKGVRVHRCWQFVPRRINTWKRIVHEGSFVLSSFLRQLTLPAPDVYVVVSPPLLLGAAAWLLSKLKGAPFVFHVQDLQPDAAAGLGMLKNGLLVRALYALEALAYRKAARLSGITPGMLEAFRKKGVPAERLILFPNGVALPGPEEWPEPGAFRRRLGLSPEAFVVLYSGNLGVKQGLDVLIEAARRLEDERIVLVICGDGSQREALQTRVTRLALTNVRMLPLQPERAYREMLRDADLCVITQQPGSGGFFFPSKLLTTLAWKKPVLTVADRDSELVQALEQGGFGLNVEPGEPHVLATLLQRLSTERDSLESYGRAGRRFVEQFALNRVLQDFTVALESLAPAVPLPAAAPAQYALRGGNRI